MLCVCLLCLYLSCVLLCVCVFVCAVCAQFLYVSSVCMLGVFAYFTCVYYMCVLMLHMSLLHMCVACLCFILWVNACACCGGWMLCQECDMRPCVCFKFCCVMQVREWFALLCVFVWVRWVCVCFTWVCVCFTWVCFVWVFMLRISLRHVWSVFFMWANCVYMYVVCVCVFCKSIWHMYLLHVCECRNNA